MSTILTSAIITSAMAVVDDYIAAANALSQELDQCIRTLTANDFMGDAANGYTELYNAKVSPAINENLTAPSGSLTASIKQMLDQIRTQLINTVDPNLGNSNRSGGGTGGDSLSG
ncbi:MAG: hypothetical protein J6Z45_06485 [Oscillospiraceae bacterium]|nr:hypothetical protein [Oscillospiraceae bacterium]